jgi:hypothetical protein
MTAQRQCASSSRHPRCHQARCRRALAPGQEKAGLATGLKQRDGWRGWGDGATRPEPNNAVANIWFHGNHAFCDSFSIGPGRGQFSPADGILLRSRKCAAGERRRWGLMCSSIWFRAQPGQAAHLYRIACSIRHDVLTATLAKAMFILDRACKSVFSRAAPANLERRRRP